MHATETNSEIKKQAIKLERHKNIAQIIAKTYNTRLNSSIATLLV